MDYRWHQFFSFGNGDEVPKNSIHVSIPRHQVHRLRDVGYPEQEYYLCLGVRGRGATDEPNWQPDPVMEEGEDLFPDEDNLEGEPLHKWNGMQIVSTRCSNKGAVIEWVYVPFIVETDSSGGGENKDDNSEATTDETVTLEGGRGKNSEEKESNEEL